MHVLSITKAIIVGLLASAPLAAAIGISDGLDFEKRHVGSPASYASKVVREAIPEAGPEAWVDKREPHHTEAQIAQKAAAAAAAASPASTPATSCKSKRHHTEAQIAQKNAAAAAAAAAASPSPATPAAGC